jgi:ribonuclease R
VKLYAHLTAQLKSGKRQKYPALVTDLRNFGFNVEVPSLGLSGLVHLSSMQDDFYVLDPAQNRLIGRSTRRIIKLGDNLAVQVCRVDPFKKQVDFQIARSGGNTRPTPSKGRQDSGRPAGSAQKNRTRDGRRRRSR